MPLAPTILRVALSSRTNRYVSPPGRSGMLLHAAQRFGDASLEQIAVLGQRRQPDAGRAGQLQ
jgi:hypothetical protein